jgi:hypothetical protein
MDGVMGKERDWTGVCGDSCLYFIRYLWCHVSAGCLVGCRVGGVFMGMAKR